MACSIYAHVRVDEAAITDSDRGFIKNPVQLTDIIERQVNQLELLVLRGGSMQVLDEEACAHEGPVPTPPSHHTPWLRDTPRTRTGAG